MGTNRNKNQVRLGNLKIHGEEWVSTARISTPAPDVSPGRSFDWWGCAHTEYLEQKWWVRWCMQGECQGAVSCQDKRASAVAPYLLQNKHYEKSLVNPTYAGASCPLHLDSPVYYWHVTSGFHCFFEYDIITWPDVGS